MNSRQQAGRSTPPQLRRVVILFLTTLLLTPALPREARAIDRAGVVKNSRLIFSVTILEAKAIYQKMLAYGSMGHYLVRHRMRVKVGMVLRGRRSLLRGLSANRQLWLLKSSGILQRMSPGWKQSAMFRSSYNLAHVRKGDEIIVYLRTLPQSVAPGLLHTLSADYLDGITMLPTVQRQVEKVIEPEVRELRKRTSRCKALWTYAYAGGCRSLLTIRSRLQCPDGTRPFSRRLDGEARVGCRRLNGALNGTMIAWHRNGELRRRWTVSMNVIEGPLVEFDQRGVRLRQIQYRNGRKDGYWISWHGNGKKALEGSMANNLPDGHWKQWSTDGRALGSYRLKRGTGTVTRWHHNGRKKSEFRLVNGIRDGRFRIWNAAGVLLKVGKYNLGRPDGRWKLNTQRGEFKRLVCFRRGRMFWESSDPGTALNLPCR